MCFWKCVIGIVVKYVRIDEYFFILGKCVFDVGIENDFIFVVIVISI